MRRPSSTPIRAIILLAALALPACNRAKSEPERATASAAVAIPVHVASVAAKDRPTALTLDGTLLADEASSVTSVVSGRIVAVYVEKGSKVEAGAPMIGLRDVDYKLSAKTARAKLEEARARLGMKQGKGAPRLTSLPEVAVAKADLDLAESELARAEKLSGDGVLSAQELDQLRTKAASARDRYQTALNNGRAQIATLHGAEAALEQASTSADETIVRAPFAGEIASRLVSVGEYVLPQTPVVELVKTDPLRIELSVPQQHLRSVQPGQTVSLVVDAMPDRSFEAKVRYVSASVDRSTRALTVEAVVANADGLLRPGLFATARLQTGGSEIVAEVPAAAVRTSAGVSRVFVVQDGVVRERVISVAERTADTVVVAEGLSKGEQVAVDSLDQLGDGVTVDVVG